MLQLEVTARAVFVYYLYVGKLSGRTSTKRVSFREPSDVATHNASWSGRVAAAISDPTPSDND